MEHLRHAMKALVARLEGTFPQSGSIEDTTRIHLRMLCIAAEKAQQAGELDRQFAELRQYWLDSIDWCSQLSREVEKLLIMQEELRASSGSGVS